MQLIHFTMKKHGGKTCAAGAPGGISCTNNSYTPNVSMHTFSKNEKVRDQWVKFVYVHRPDWKLTSNSALCSVHFHESCFTRLKLSRLLPANTSDENSISSEESSSTKPKEKRVLVTGSVPTIQCAIQAPVIEQSARETVWKRYIDDIFSPWDISKPDIEAFIEQANLHHPTIKFTAEISHTETVFLDTIVYKGTRFKEKSILDVKTHFKKTETFQYTHFTSCHPPSVKKGFVKGEALRILRTNSSKSTFEENISNFKIRLIDRGYPETMIENLLSDIKFTERESALLKHNNKEEKEILPFVTQYQPSVSTLKEVLMKNWNLIQNQPLLRQIFKEPPIISYKKGKSLKDMLVRAKI